MLNPLDLLRGVLEWGVQQFGLAGFGIGVGTLFTVGMWLWWGFKLRVILSVAGSLGRTLAQHALVSILVTALALVGMLWVGIIPGVNVNAAIDIGGDLVDALTEVVG